MPDPELQREAERAGILPGYQAAGGLGWRETSDATCRALLDALGDARSAPEPATLTEPQECVRVSECVGPRPTFGLWLNLYGLRGDDFGIGHLSHVAALAEWAARAGADFVGLSPLHALRNVGTDVSPYSPRSRLFLNPLYIDPRATPEFERTRPLQEWLARPEVAREVEALRAAERVDYARTRTVLQTVWSLLHAQFEDEARASDTTRSRDYARFVAEGGTLLRDFATFVCLEDHFAALEGRRDWRSWPGGFHAPDTAAVAAFRKSHAEAVAREMWLQFEAERQLARAQQRARHAGMRIGLYRDLALASSASSFDAWAFPELFVSGVHIGAPPDDYAAHGQDWGLPPLDPRLLAGRDPHPYLTALLDTNLRHAGALRIDHVMGLFRQFWIPADAPSSAGAYVRFPASALLDHIGRASQRHRALIIGEDLGTVPEELPAILERQAILSCRVLFFERNADRSLPPPHALRSHALLTATTHDMPPLAGYLRGRDLDILHQVGTLSDADHARAMQLREADRAQLRKRLEESGLWSDAAAQDPLALACAVYRLLRQSPSALVGVGLDDLLGETEPVNVPGVSVAAYPSWSRRISTTVESLIGDARIADALHALADTRDPDR